ncbi:MAG: MBL fold metallo-hydrolase [Bryobacteraceae bacterium]|nr:MBL fold metallo-hydrolase [Bryobacteraceae bacterium]
MNSLLARLAVLLCLAPVLLPAAKNLELFFIDVEGGQATLIVSPSGESLLVDAGWPGFEGRDANRIMAVAKKAGVKRIDYLLVTHFHTDHVGGVPQLAEKFPIISFVDHGDNTETGRNADRLSSEYKRVVEKAKRLTLKPGDVLPIKGVDVRIVTARGAVLSQPLPGAGSANALCASAEKSKDDPSENARSLGFVLSYRDKFRFVDLGDLTWNKEIELVCPNNNIGTVDLYLTTHHGMDISNPSTIVHSLKPRVAIMNNGARKGGSPAAWKVFRHSPGLEDLWQLHYAVAGGTETNVPDVFIANLEERCQGNYIQVSVTPDGEFTVLNSRNRYKKTYKAR